MVRTVAYLKLVVVELLVALVHVYQTILVALIKLVAIAAVKELVVILQPSTAVRMKNNVAITKAKVIAALMEESVVLQPTLQGVVLIVLMFAALTVGVALKGKLV